MWIEKSGGVESRRCRELHRGCEGNAGRIELILTLQLAFVLYCLMRILRPVIFPKALLAPTGQSHMPETPAVGAQLVGDQQFRHEALLLEQLADQPQRPPTVGWRWISISRTSPSSSTARHDTSVCGDRTTISSKTSDRSAEGAAGAAVARSRGRISAPIAAPFHRRCRDHARPAAPRHRGSSG